MFDKIKTYTGHPRVVHGWRGVEQWLARVVVDVVYRCKECGKYLTKQQAKDHKHDKG